MGNSFISHECIVSNVYDLSGGVRNSFRLLASDGVPAVGGGKAVAVLIGASFAGIGSNIKTVSFIALRSGTTVGNYTITLESNAGTVKATYSENANNLSDAGYTLYQRAMNVCAAIASGDRITVKYSGTAQAVAFLAIGIIAASMPTNTTGQLLDTTDTWQNQPTDTGIMFTFDSTV